MTPQNRALAGMFGGLLGVVAGTALAIVNGMALVSAGLVADATGAAGAIDPAVLALGVIGGAVAIAGFMTAAVNFARWRQRTVS